LTLAIQDESGFSFVPNCNNTWAPVGETPILRETPGRHNHTGIGIITRTPVRHLLTFFLMILKGAATFEDFVLLLTCLHFRTRKKVLVLWDNLPTHHAVEAYFEEERPGWFEFEYFPAYSPEANPVEGCWNMIKNVYLPNFVPTSDEELTREVMKAARNINEEKQLTACFQQAKISPW
jgi:transposase